MQIYFYFFWFSATVTTSLMGFIVASLFFIQSRESIFMISHDLFYDIYNTITEHNRRQTQYLSSVPFISAKLLWYLVLSESKSSITSSASSIIMISILSLFECITRSSSLSIKKIKLFAVANWIFHVSDFLRLLCLLNMV